MGAIVPWDIVANPKKMRWGICTQDVCFKRPFLHAIVSAGQAMPIHRGGGIDQPLLLDVARHVSAGHWVHVFPEGRVIQSGNLGVDPLTQRTEAELASMGRLKWGVGKLIAHSARTPIVIPMHHSGMPQIIVQHNVWRPDGHGGQYFDNRCVRAVCVHALACSARLGAVASVCSSVCLSVCLSVDACHAPIQEKSY